MPNELEKDIYRTITYFAYFGYPVTGFEIYKWQLQPQKTRSYFDITSTLATSSWLRSQIERKNGFYALKDIKTEVRLRHDRFLNAVQKYKKLKKVLNYVARVPSVKGVALCNSLPLHFTKSTSDIDLFVITKDHKVWTTRMLTVLPMILLRQRPGETKRDPVDLSFLASESALDFSQLKLGEADPYMSVWLRTLVPVYEQETGIFEKFLLQNSWAKLDLPNSILANRALRERVKVKNKLPLFIGERLAKKIQLKKFPVEITDHQNIDSTIVVSDKLLKFHKNDRRAEVAEFLNSKMNI
ncbi:hypothetical protein COY25_00280 [Candidatus Uhrbacteria bacterium CG_4_10_14_0_2_um_filter_41_7]|uniref:Polymerase nucleotidyl transferase domain-containing protein n=1 Tax=Candidatus Uhrbacteria bacterium CG_4_9_14_3_um_filter_41_35 TaxID=1975034 RepID=A0A2M7XGN3_9BACT|nr:MAG: hypothetical protein COY25_00280 [Candidatus Uhrbacteria bacterium CG_4_10_14_0_2_um_filter_41_7]PJA46896.1 MAG: hypothetical protein CO173_00700 [Candidatus Uhrbacteria bacterium CG_4_9_14_3_um_filter_41_35]